MGENTENKKKKETDFKKILIRFHFIIIVAVYNLKFQILNK